MVLLIILVLIIMDTQNKHKLAQPKNKNTNKCIKKSKSIKAESRQDIFCNFLCNKLCRIIKSHL